MTWICYVGIEVSANFQKALLGDRADHADGALGVGAHSSGRRQWPAGHLVALAWFDPFKVKHFSDLVIGLADMLFIYWGWDTALNLNEETKDAETIPGKAGRLLHVRAPGHLRAGHPRRAVLRRHRHERASASATATTPTTCSPSSVPPIFGHSTFASILDHLLLLMVLSSAAASTQTTILPTARTVLSMSVHKALPNAFSKVHKRFLTPTVATITFGVVSIALYVVMNFISAGDVIADSIDALGVMIAFYYGLTGFSCFWYYRKQLTKSVHNFFVQGMAPLFGGLILWSILGWSFWYYWNPSNSYTVLASVSAATLAARSRSTSAVCSSDSF